MKNKGKIKVLDIKPADNTWGVTTFISEEKSCDAFQRQPCKECPWRKDSEVGKFPPAAFKFSATTSYDASMKTFACHMSGSDNPHTCAGFLLSNSANNIAVRLAQSSGRIDLEKVSSQTELYASYKDMAIANGVDPDDPALEECRGDGEAYVYKGR